jgi:hypothetical protein
LWLHQLVEAHALLSFRIYELPIAAPRRSAAMALDRDDVTVIAA